MRALLLSLAWLALIDPTFAQNAWTQAGATSVGRLSHTFTALADGRALVAGGKTSVFSGGTATAEVYDPTSNAWSVVATMRAARADHAAVRLADGRVLVVGGCASGAPCNPPRASAEIYDPAFDSWAPTGSLATPRSLHTANLLPDGRVIVFGGQGTCNSSICQTLSSTEIYDPASQAWTPGPSMPQPRLQATTTTLDDGRVLVAGGCTSSGLPCSVLSSIVYDPATNQFTNAATMVVPRTEHTAVLLANGDVLVAGGVNSGSFSQRSAEIYHPATNSWSAAPDSLYTHFEHAMERLPSGDVLVAGGQSGSTLAEVYSVAGNFWAQVGSLAVGRESPRMTRLAGGEVVIAGGDDGLNGIAAAERFQQGTTPLVSLAPGSIGFGYQALANRSDAVTLTVKNIGSAPLSISSVTLAGANPGDFSFVSHCGGPVPAGGSCAIGVRFKPLGLKDRSATLVIADNAPNSPHAAGLSGYGYVDAPNFWAPTGTMNEARFRHTLTGLPDGRALAIGGGFNSPRVEAWSAGVWHYVAPMTFGRAGHTSTTLPDGRILAAGGAVTPSAEAYDAASDTWALTGPMGALRAGHAAARLASGKVIVFGGCASGPCSTTEIYDPGTNAWTPGPGMSVARSLPTATMLLDGRALVAGGSTTSTAAEIYDPSSNSFASGGTMQVARSGHTADRLPDGRVIVAGGCGGSYCASTEIFDPATVGWRRADAMTRPRVSHISLTLPDGRVLVAGGIYRCESEFGFCFSSRSVDIYDPTMQVWKAYPSLLEPRANFAAGLLQSGQVLVSGGDDNFTEPKATAEILTPAAP